MAWQKTEWACGHKGQMQLYGKQTSRDATVAQEAGRKCMVCWLVAEWEKGGDPRAQREDRYNLAASIAESKGKLIYIGDSLPSANVPQNPLATFTVAELEAELERRRCGEERC